MVLNPRLYALLCTTLAAALLAVSACDDAGSCESDDDCFSGEYCYEGRCAPDPGDSDVGGDDADSGLDTSDDDTAAMDTESTDATDSDEPTDTEDATAEDTQDEDSGETGPEVISIAAGGLHTCAILSSGEAMCWGDNTSGAIGHGDENASEELTPVRVSGITNVTSLDGGHLHTCAIQGYDSLWCWGSNGSEQIAPSSPSQIYAPVSVGLNDVAQVVAGDSHTCARLNGGGTDCWSDISTVNGVPSGLGTMSDLAAGFRHSCGITGGEVHCWGRDFEDQTGDGSPVSGITDAVDVVAGKEHTCALLQSGEVECWGDNGAGQLGDEGTLRTSTPVTVQNLSDVTQIGAGLEHNCALTSAGAVLCWGKDGEAINSPVPDGVFGLNSGVEQIAVGGYHSCALLASGEVRCWGLGGSGQLGNDSGRSSSRPVRVEF